MLRRNDLESRLTEHGDRYTIDQHREMQRELNALNAALNGEDLKSEDELVDSWERDIEAGRTPDLTKGLHG